MKTAAFLALAMLATATFGQQKLDLAGAIRLARSNSPTLRAASEDARAAAAAARIGRAETLPQLSANGFATTGNQSSILGSPPMSEPAAFMMAAPGTFVDGNLMLMAPLIATRAWAMASASNWQSRAAAGELLEARSDLDLRVAESYYAILLARQMASVAEARVAAARELVKNAQAQFEAGAGIQAAVSRAQAELASGERELASARNDELKALLDLRATIGIDLNQQLEIYDDNPPADVPSTEDAIERALRARGMLIAARARVAAAGAEVRAAENQRAPQLYGVAMGDVTNRRDMGGVTAGLTLSFPIVDGGRISGQVAQAKAMRSRAEAVLREAELTVGKEVRQAALDLATARANEASAEASKLAAQSAYDVMSLRVSAGKSILVEQLDSLRSLTEAKADLARAHYDFQLAAARLQRAAGGKP